MGWRSPLAHSYFPYRKELHWISIVFLSINTPLISQFSIRSPLVLFNVFQEIPVTSKKSLKLNWKFILMQMNLTSKMTSYFNGKSMEKRCLGKTIVFLMDFQLNDVIVQCTINGKIMYWYFKQDCLPLVPNTGTRVIILMQCLHIKYTNKL